MVLGIIACIFAGIIFLLLSVHIIGQNAGPFVWFVFGDVVAVLVLLLFLAKGILSSLHNITKTLEKVQGGDLQAKIPPGVFTEMQEITLMINEMIEKMRQEKEEAQEAKIMLGIIPNLSDGLIVLNEKNSLELMNPSAEEILGLKAQSLLGKRIGELKNILAFQPIAEALGESIQGVFRKEALIHGARTIEVTAASFPLNGKKRGSLVVLHDITREKQVEKVKTEFVSLAAHQLRTPLSAVKWTLHMFLDGDLGVLTKEQIDFIKKTHRANERMISLVNDLLDVARIEEGRYGYNFASVPMEKVLDPLIQLYTEEAKRQKIDFVFEQPHKESPRALVDIEKMRLAIQNLLENALRYTLPKGKVTVSLQYDTKNVKVSVQDTGIGIPQEEQHRLFERFFRASNAIKVETEGSGLGLYLVKNIVEAHRGSIDFTSKENKGTTVSLTIPIS